MVSAYRIPNLGTLHSEGDQIGRLEWIQLDDELMWTRSEELASE